MRCLQQCKLPLSRSLLIHLVRGAFMLHTHPQSSDFLVFTVDNLVGESRAFSVCTLPLTALSQRS